MMKSLFFLVVAILGVASATAEQEKDHNGEEHKALCDLLKAAVTKWGDSGQTLSDQLKKALGKTIFGEGAERDLEELKKGLPKVYEEVVKDYASRNMACGQQRNEMGEYGSVHQPRWSGHSAPHDLVCLCTLGNSSWPLNDTQKATTLCGKGLNALGSGKGNNGWSAIETGLDQIKATWGVVVTPCLQGETGRNLKEALKNFMGKLEQNPDGVYTSRYRLGEGNISSYAGCNGTPELGDCVMYYNSTIIKKDNMPWWVDLQKAIPEDEQIQKQRDEEAKRKQQEEAAKKEAQKTEDLKSEHPTTNQTQQNKTATLHETMRKLNLTGSSSIITPHSWLLSVAILI